jgi:hypothetical protein
VEGLDVGATTTPSLADQLRARIRLILRHRKR